ncbi:unnamed protein product, partial [Urochloa humidicola]
AEAEAMAAVAAASCQPPTPYHPDVRVHAELPSPARTSGFQAACGSIGSRSARARSSSGARCRRFLSLSPSGRRRSPSPWTGQQRPPPPPRTEASGGLVAAGLDAAAGVDRSAKSELLLRWATRRPWYAALPPFTLIAVRFGCSGAQFGDGKIQSTWMHPLELYWSWTSSSQKKIGVISPH